MPPEFYVYLWRDPKDTTPRYVGKGSGERAWGYIESTRNNILTGRMLRKRHQEGYVCIPEIIWVENEAEAFELETLLIATIGRKDLGFGPLFNKTDGGEGAANPSIDTLKKKRASYQATARTPEFKERRRLVDANPDTQTRRSRSQFRAQNNPITNARRSHTLRLAALVPGMHEKRSASATRANNKLEVKLKIATTRAVRLGLASPISGVSL